MNFIQGALAPFGHIPFLFQVPSSDQNVCHMVDRRSGFDRDAENLHQDWIKVGNYINDVISDDEQQSSEQQSSNEKR
jgi:hypothetical protein